MVSKSHAKRRQDIKTKLMAAIAMLLVSSIMMVSSTYAWFTLSTAPEVTGISTQVGANGNLEMALLPTNGFEEGAGKDYGITSEVGDSKDVQGATAANVTWGNLVDLSDNSVYGLDKITLYPSALDGTFVEGNLTQLAEVFLKTPSYGSDGRVSELVANTVTSTYSKNDSVFPQNEESGVRAVGAASGMTDRQIAFRSYRSAASSAMSQAQTLAGQSLSRNGSNLANIVVVHAAGTGDHTMEDVNTLLAVCNDLIGEDGKGGVFKNIEDAYKNYIIAYAASAAGGTDDTAAMTVIESLNAATTLDGAIDVLEEKSITLPDAIQAKVNALANSKNEVVLAKGKLESLKTSGETEFSWTDITDAMNHIVNADEMTINGHTAAAISADKSLLINAVLGGSVNVEVASGAGVFADIADHCGDYEASINVGGNGLEYQGTPIPEIGAKMKTKSNLPKAYLQIIAEEVTEKGAPASGGTGGQKMPISEFYGYIIDLGFRTNASSSNLLLQTAPVDRIYDDNHNPDTMGGGSTITFTSTTPDFTIDQMAGLMEALRVVFFNPDDNSVYATAKLDMRKDASGNTNYTVGTTDITANLYLYEVTPAGTNTTYAEAKYPATHKWVDGEDGAEGNWVEANDGTATHVQVQVTEGGSEDTPTYNYVLATGPATHALVDGEYVEAKHVSNGADGYKTAEEGETPTHAEVVTGEGEEQTKSYVKAEYVEVVSNYDAGENFIITDKDNNTYASITELTQNQAKAVSVLVYLDGENITNADVAATAATSMTGSLNLQFSSSADLVPMSYGQLQMDETEKTEFNVSFVNTTDITVTGNTKATKGTNYGFEVTLPDDCENWDDFVDKYTVTVTIGDGTADDITDTVAIADGSGTIPGSDITGDIVITIQAK